MCRWFAYISPTEPCLLEDVLITPRNSLTHQVHDHYLPQLIAHNPSDLQSADHLTTARNSLYNIDGLGVAWYTSSFSDFERGNTGESSDGSMQEGLRPAVYKAVQPPLNDMNFRSLCRNTETRVCMAHIRAASGTPIVAVNNHPFVFGRHTFMHNGVVSNFTQIKRIATQQMSEAAFSAVNGGTDSEHLAALYMTHLTQNSSSNPFEQEYPLPVMAAALHWAISTIITLQKSLLTTASPNSLNLCVTDGKRLVACRFRNHATEQPPSLYYSTKAGVTLNRKFPDHPDGIDVPGRWQGIKGGESHGRHVIVASEPSTYIAEEWELVGRNEMVLVDEGGGVEVREVEYERGWDCEDAGA
ncbi:N-terminal nucleophile aminohydrolase [Teratosphaeria nubilosa]|uniref:N-terminal nucleophile aminohydrolase n=1 Tax=Teratosphaeria nubilosa TaxID=161662 RepID=A0A6G1L9B5_9PEZI|nr:N-terminal nucleophile aminohydrolase [Teratosphaeria nubilosa]